MPANPGKCFGSSRTKAWVDPEVEPDFDQVVDLVVSRGIVLRPEEPLLRALGEPGVGAFPLVGVGDPRVHLVVEQDFVTVLADENRQGHPPGALARQHPIGLVGDHALDPVLAGRRRPSRAFNRVDRKDPKRLAALRIGERPIHRQEPLRRVAKDDWRLRAPAVGVLVLEFSARDERPGLDQRVDDGLVGVAGFALIVDDALALEAGRFVGQSAVLVDRVGNAGIDASLLKQPRARRPKLEILAPMARSGVNEARARVFRHMVAVEQRNDETVAARMERMGADHECERIACDFAEKFERADLRRVEDALSQRLREDVGRADLGPIVRRRVRHPITPVSNAPGEGDRAIARESSTASWSR